MKRYAARLGASILALSLLLSLAACGGSGATAATMHLTRAEGTVAVSDGDGKDVPLLDNLGLYSGYGVGTQSESYAWINLDDAKLTKMDQSSQIAIQKDGKHLEIEVKSGSLFFNVTQPLGDDETLNIRTSTMLIGVRGTCGWVEERDDLSRVYLLEGKVECSAGDRTVQVSAGEVGSLTADGELTVDPFPTETIPAFVRNDLDPDLIDRLGAAPESAPTAEPSPGPASSPESDFLIIDGVLRSYLGPGGAVVIPDSVTSIGNFAFGSCDSLTSVTIPDSVTSIEEWAFYECANLTAVTMPDSITAIKERTFCGCSSLTDVTIPNGVTVIGLSAFLDCGSLASVTIPGSVTTIENAAFSNCGSLTSVTIPNSVTSIGASAFAGCGSLTAVAIPDSVTRIEELLFYNCGSLASVTIPGSVTRIEDAAFFGCGSLTAVTIPNGVTSIGETVFWDCANLASVTIPGSVTSIGDDAFAYCSDSLVIYFGGSEAQWNQIANGRNISDLLYTPIRFNS